MGQKLQPLKSEMNIGNQETVMPKSEKQAIRYGKSAVEYLHSANPIFLIGNPANPPYRRSVSLERIERTIIPRTNLKRLGSSGVGRFLWMLSGKTFSLVRRQR
jgi:hypothetical protein